MGLYDGVTAPTSTFIDTHAPLPVAALERDNNQLNDQYDQGRANEDALNGAMASASAGPFKNDQLILAQAKEQLNREADNRAAAGDYEHMGRSVAMSARKFGNIYGQLQANAQAHQTYIQSLQDANASTNPHVYIDDEKMKNAIKTSMDNYGDGMQVGDNGKLTNYFNGYKPSATYDIAGESAKLLSNMKESGTDIGNSYVDSDPKSASFMHAIHVENGVKVRSGAKADQIVQSLIQSRPEWMADLKDRAYLHSAAQGKDASAAELYPYFKQSEIANQAQQYRTAHPNATPDDIQGAKDYASKTAAAKYAEYAKNPNFDPINNLTQVKLRQSIEGFGHLEGNLFDSREIKHDLTIGADMTPATKAPSGTTDDLVNGHSITIPIPISKEADPIHNGSTMESAIESAHAATSATLQDITAAQNDQKKTGTDRTKDIAHLNTVLKENQELETGLNARKIEAIKYAGMDKPLDPAAQALKYQKDQNDRVDATHAAFNKDFANNPVWASTKMLHSLIAGDVPQKGDMPKTSLLGDAYKYVTSKFKSPLENDPRYSNYEDFLERRAAPGMTNQSIVVLPNKKTTDKLNSIGIAMMKTGNTINLGGDKGIMSPISVDDSNGYTNVKSVGTTNIHGKKHMVMTGESTEGTGASAKTTTHLMAVPIDASLTDEVNQESGMPAEMDNAFALKDKIDTKYGHDISDGHGGKTSYNKSFDNLYTKTVKEGPEYHSSEQLTGEQLLTNLASEHSPIGEQSRIFMDQVVRGKVPYHIGVQGDGKPGFKIEGDGHGKVNLVTWTRDGKAVVAKPLREYEARTMIQNHLSHDAELRAKQSQQQSN